MVQRVGSHSGVMSNSPTATIAVVRGSTRDLCLVAFPNGVSALMMLQDVAQDLAREVSITNSASRIEDYLAKLTGYLCI